LSKDYRFLLENHNTLKGSLKESESGEGKSEDSCKSDKAETVVKDYVVANAKDYPVLAGRMAEKGQTTNVKDYVLANAEDYPVLAARM
jgi:hypothetical protein